MSSRKEKLLAKKKAEMETLESDILRNKSKAGKKRRLLPKVLGVAALIFIGGPILLTLTMSPEVKAEMKLERERVEAEKLAAANDKKVETITKSIKRSIETNNYAELKRGIDQLKVLAPEQVSQYAGDVSRVKVASAEKSQNKTIYIILSTC